MDGLGGNRHHLFRRVLGFFVVGFRFVVMDRFVGRLHMSLGMMMLANVMVRSSNMLPFLMRLAPLLCGRRLLWPMLLNRYSRLVMGRLFMDRFWSARLLMGVNLGRGRLRLMRMELRMSFDMMFFDRLGSRRFMYDRRFGGRLFSRRQSLGMFGFDLDDRGFELVELAA
nr:hypothetical protein [Rhizobium miluonense]